MPRSKTRPGYVPNVVECSKCRRPLDPREYQAYPNADTPEENVTRVHAPLWPAFSVHCTCNQYTIFSPQKNDDSSRQNG